MFSFSRKFLVTAIPFLLLKALIKTDRLRRMAPCGALASLISSKATSAGTGEFSAHSQECGQCVADNVGNVIITIPGFDPTCGFPREPFNFTIVVKL